MSRVFAYARVSTVGQTLENQRLEIERAGFDVKPQRFISEQVSGSVNAKMRPAWQELLVKIEPGDVVVVTKLDRLGRSMLDIHATIEELKKREVALHVLQLGGLDLLSGAGKLQLAIFAAMAEFERDLIIERTQSGLKRAKAQGKKLGRPPKLTVQKVKQIKRMRDDGISKNRISQLSGVSRASVNKALGMAEGQ